MGNSININLIITLAILLLIVVIIIFLFSKLKRFNNRYGSDIKKIYTAYKESENLPDDPKSLSGMDSVYLPMINEDFPDLNIAGLKSHAKQALQEILDAIESKDLTKIKATSNLVAKKVESILENQERLDQHEFFNDVKFHNVVISQYERNPGYLSIVFQVGLEFIHYIMQNEKIINGSKEKKQQERFEVAFAYIQDVNKIEDEALKTGLYGLNCPNCAAPIKTLGQKYCEYCGTGIVEVNSKAWIMIDFARN